MLNSSVFTNMQKMRYANLHSGGSVDPTEPINFSNVENS